MAAKFKLGQTVMTRGISDFIKEENITLDEVMNRHVSGDWGDISEDDKQANEDGLDGGDRLLSAYELGGRKIWIISEADRSVTTVLFPEEY